MKQKKQKEKRRRRAPFGFLLTVLLFCIALTYLWNVWYIPYLPKTEIPPFLSGLDLASDTQNPDSASNAPMSATDSGTAYRRRAGVYNMLVAGKDDAAYNTDVLMLISYDTKQQTAAIVQLPRDIYLDGYKINALWAKYRSAAKKSGSASPDADGMEHFCDTLEETLCIRIDNWVLCSLSAFRNIVDSIGGVTLSVPCDMDYEDPAQNLSIHLKAGPQTLNGSQAEQLVRFRSGYVRGDLGRTEVQKLFLTALLDRLKGGISVMQLPGLITEAVKAIDTSLSFSDILFFVKEARSLDFQNVFLLTLPGTACREYGDYGAWYYVLSREGTWECVNRYLNVYETEVDAKQFDRLYRLTDPEKSALLSYYQTYLKADILSGADVRDNGVSVAVLPKE